MSLHKSLALGQRYQGKTVLVTGHTGFKGSWLTAWLLQLGAKVVGLSLDPSTEPSHFIAAGLSGEITDLRVDVRDRAAVEGAVLATKPDFVFHLAAQALVRRSYEDPLETWHTNLMGTLNILEGLRKLERPCAVVLVTSDKCYDNVEWLWGYRETDALGGHDPYSSSKAASELVIDSYRRSFFTNTNIFVASARAGNVIGGGDWSEDRLIPDIVRAVQKNEDVTLRNPNAVRPWQHVLDPIFGYLLLAKTIDEKGTPYCETYNFGPRTDEAKTVLEVCKTIMSELSAGNVVIENQETLRPHEAGLLTLDISKSMSQLGWSPTWNSSKALQRTASWYKNFLQSGRAISLMKNDINLFIKNETI